MELVRALILGAGLAPLFAAPVTLQNATATYSQNFGGYAFNASTMIDGIYTSVVSQGWAIFDPTYGTIAQTAVFETVSDTGFAGGTDFTFQMHQLYQTEGHTVGRFRLSVTTDSRGTFADGLQVGGDVTANWTVLTPTSVAGTGGETLSVLGDGSVLASGVTPASSVYTFVATTLLTGITGIRIEVLEDGSLPDSGPGRYYTNGNFVLTEFTVDAIDAGGAGAVPEPATAGLVVVAITALGFMRKRRRP